MLDTNLTLTARRTASGTVVSATLFDGTECFVGESPAMGSKRAMIEMSRRDDIQSMLRRLEHRNGKQIAAWAERESADLINAAAELGIDIAA